MKFWKKITNRLSKTKEKLSGQLKDVIQNSFGKTSWDIIEEVEEVLLTSDIGPDLTEKYIEHIKKKKPEDIIPIIRKSLLETLQVDEEEIQLVTKPEIIVIIGVNGTGKTTSAARLAYYYKQKGKKILLAAADTFRPAGIDQLEIWAEKLEFDFVKGEEGGDAAAVVHDAYDSAKAKDKDIIIVDTAGRLHTKKNLMNELLKIDRVIKKKDSSAPHQVLLVLDATTGQNSIQQAKIFNQYLKITGLILTKLDGTAKGGCIFPIVDQLNIPVKFIGIGERKDDFDSFDAEQFIESIFTEEIE